MPLTGLDLMSSATLSLRGEKAALKESLCCWLLEKVQAPLRKRVCLVRIDTSIKLYGKHGLYTSKYLITAMQQLVIKILKSIDKNM